MTESKNENASTGVRNAYFGVLNQTADFAKQSTESTKKVIGATLDAQSDILKTVGESNLHSSAEDITRLSYGFLESAAKQTSQGINMAANAFAVFTDAALTWQKVTLEAQKNVFQSYKSWFTGYKA
ncbi:MAG TPA: hypothetical protein VNE86_01830 [Nitrososphaerales archaeon]|nr:hypothetical protein [Nitrososphaerales archaeon]